MTTPINGDVTAFASTLARADASSVRQVERRGAAPGGVAPTGEGPDFAGRLRELLDDANQSQVQATEAAEAYASGERNDLHGTMIALEQADITFRLVSNVRSRLVEAYREVMRMGS